MVVRDVPRALDDDLHVLGPRPLRELAQGVELRELGAVAGVGEGAGAKGVAQRQGAVGLAAHVDDLVEALVKRVLLLIRHHPAGEERPAAADHPAQARLGAEAFHRQAGDAAMEGDEIDVVLDVQLHRLQHE